MSALEWTRSYTEMIIMAKMITQISFDEITPSEFEQYENDPLVEVVVNGDLQCVFVERHW